MTAPRGPLAALRAAATAQGSTRAVALLRIGLVFILWARYGESLVAFRHPDPAWWAVAALFWASTAALLVGWRTRWAAAGAGLAAVALVAWLGAIRGHEPFTHHHTTLLAIVTPLLALTPCGASFSVDRLQAVRRARAEGRPPPPERGPLWATRLIALQLSSTYLFSAVDKLHLGWLGGARMEQIFIYHYTGSVWPQWPGFSTLMLLAGSGSVVLELSLALGLWSRRLRPWLIPLGLAFHALIYVTLPVETFSATMALCYLAFLDPERVHALIDEQVGAPPPQGALGG